MTAVFFATKADPEPDLDPNKDGDANVDADPDSDAAQSNRWFQ